jgi:hypothetical protein
LHFTNFLRLNSSFLLKRTFFLLNSTITMEILDLIQMYILRHCSGLFRSNPWYVPSRVTGRRYQQPKR